MFRRNTTAYKGQDPTKDAFPRNDAAVLKLLSTRAHTHTHNVGLCKTVRRRLLLLYVCFVLILHNNYYVKGAAFCVEHGKHGN